MTTDTERLTYLEKFGTVTLLNNKKELRIIGIPIESDLRSAIDKLMGEPDEDEIIFG